MQKEEAPKVLWAPLPLISWVLPFVGHVGVTDTQGIVYEFAGTYTVRSGSLMGGPALLEVDVQRAWPNVRINDWDNALRAANTAFQRRSHNIFTQNCHHHIAAVLRGAGVRTSAFGVFTALLLKGSYVRERGSPSTIAARVRVMGPFAMLLFVCAVGIGSWALVHRLM